MKMFKVINLRKIIDRKNYILCGTGLFLLAGITFSALLPNTTAEMVSIITTVGEKELPIYCVDTDEPKVAISFDAAWGADDTGELLRILEDNDVKTTFFLCGYWVESYPDEVQMIADAGHDLGNHSSTHPHMNQLTSEEISKELMDCHNAVKDLTGIDMNLFRPPFGEYDNNVIQTTYANNYFPVQWDVETVDTKLTVIQYSYPS